MVKKNLHLEKNQIVLIEGGMVGTIKYIGKLPIDGVDPKASVRVGVKLGEGTGDSNGSYKGITYFESPTNGAIWIEPQSVIKIITSEALLQKIVELNKTKKNNHAKISNLRDTLTLAKNNPIPVLSGGVQKTEGDSDDVIKSFLEAEIKKNWYISLNDLVHRYSSRKENEVAALYSKAKGAFDAMQPAQPHSRIVYTVASSPKDNMVASGSDDKTIRLWRRIYGQKGAPVSGNEMRCITELKLRSCINSLAFHPNQDMLAAALDSGWIELYDLKTGKMMGALEGQSTSEVWTVCFSPDGNNILSGSLDRAIRVWDVRERECKWALRGHDEWVNGIAVSSDGSTIVSGSGDKTVRIWDTKTMACRKTLRGHEDFVRSVCVTGDNKHIVSASDDCSLRVWNLKDEQLVHKIPAHQKGIYCVAASKTSKVVSSSRDFSVKVWDVANPKSTPKEWKGHKGDVNSCCFFDDGKWVASCSDDKKVLCFKV